MFDRGGWQTEIVAHPCGAAIPCPCAGFFFTNGFSTLLSYPPAHHAPITAEIARGSRRNVGSRRPRDVVNHALSPFSSSAAPIPAPSTRLCRPLFPHRCHRRPPPRLTPLPRRPPLCYSTAAASLTPTSRPQWRGLRADRAGLSSDQILAPSSTADSVTPSSPHPPCAAAAGVPPSNS